MMEARVTFFSFRSQVHKLSLPWLIPTHYDHELLQKSHPHLFSSSSSFLILIPPPQETPFQLLCGSDMDASQKVTPLIFSLYNLIYINNKPLFNFPFPPTLRFLKYVHFPVCPDFQLQWSTLLCNPTYSSSIFKWQILGCLLLQTSVGSVF